MERVLTFKYPFERKDEMNNLKRVFDSNGVEFICYESNGYYSHCFKVRKSGKKWNDLYAMINSVLPVKYNFVNINMEYVDGKLVEVV